jgi:protein-S-isoprenylcysteine O-methyltransferase Ste14
MNLNKEVVLIVSLILVFVFGILYSNYIQNKEIKAMIKRLKDLPLVAVIIGLIWGQNDTTDNNNDSTSS